MIRLSPAHRWEGLSGPSLLLLASVALGWIERSKAAELSWEQASGYRSAGLSVPEQGRDGFTRQPGATSGILFTNVLSMESGVRTQLRLAGSGVAAGDIDGDGWCDLYFCGMESGNRLYRNLGGWKFEDITDQAGVRCSGQYSTGTALADVDGDGDLDLLVNSIGGGTRLFLNDGKGHFKEVTGRGLVQQYGATTMALADVDGDGTLDLYVANNNSPTALGDEPNTRFTLQVVEGKPVITAVNGKPIAGTDLAGRYGVSPFDNAIREYGQPDMLYLNNGQGRFSLLSWTNGAFMDEEGANLTAPPRDLGLSAMFRDLNEDGAPDIYVCNDLFTPDRIWINDGHGRFRALSRMAVRNSCAFSMGVDFADINRDGHDDFLVTDMLFQAHQKRIVQAPHMTPVTIRAGEKNERTQIKRNVLQLNRGDGTFAEIAQLSGLEASAWSWATLFLDVDLDGYEDVLVAAGYDRDSMNGDVDTQIEQRRSKANLAPDEIRNLGRLYPPVPSPVVAFRNLGNLRFKEVSRDWGFDWVGINQGICCADLDNDGDLEVIVNCLHDQAAVYRNESPRPRVAVRLKGTGANTRGIGAKVWLYGGAVPGQSQEMICGGRYLSCDDALRVFAAGTATNQMRIEVQWRSGKRSFVEQVKPNRIYEIDEAFAVSSPGPEVSNFKSDISNPEPEIANRKSQIANRKSDVSSSRPEIADSGPETSNLKSEIAHPGPPTVVRSSPAPLQSPTSTWFEDSSDKLKHTHHEDVFNDFARQALLPHRLSQLGPGVTWSDVDGDGREDLLIGSGRGGQLELFLNQGGQSFQRLPLAALLGRATDDQTTILGWATGHGTSGFIIGQANYESDGTNGVRRYEMWAGGIQPRETLATGASSVGPLALADLDGDGNLELFVGGRMNPGHWPQPASSRVYQLEKDKYRLNEANSQALQAVGMVSGAVFTDLDGDGYPELILACEWGPIRVFHNDHGQLRDITRQSGLDAYAGWWTSVAAGDFDGDGRMDLVAGNWGQNTKYERARSPEHPLRMYYGDWNGDARMEVLEAFYDGELKKFVPWRGLNAVARGMPWVRETFSTHTAFSTAGVEEILGARLSKGRIAEVTCLETTVFLNRGGCFQAVTLPGEAQFAPVFGLNVGDLDGDGKEDIFLSQNFFGVDEETSRYDSGRGVWLRGDGRGQFQVVPGQVSGIQVYGEGRGSALCDYDRDGRVDLAVGQNGAQTKLYHNRGAKPGLRVHLVGPAGNPTGVGAVMRLRFGDRWGPAREVHAGGGYWSQDGSVQVLGIPDPPTALWVQWPGGKTQQIAVPVGATELKVPPP